MLWPVDRGLLCVRLTAQLILEVGDFDLYCLVLGHFSSPLLLFAYVRFLRADEWLQGTYLRDQCSLDGMSQK